MVGSSCKFVNELYKPVFKIISLDRNNGNGNSLAVCKNPFESKDWCK